MTYTVSSGTLNSTIPYLSDNGKGCVCVTIRGLFLSAENYRDKIFNSRLMSDFQYSVDPLQSLGVQARVPGEYKCSYSSEAPGPDCLPV